MNTPTTITGEGESPPTTIQPTTTPRTVPACSGYGWLDLGIMATTVHRWEAVSGRHAPNRFIEWTMRLPNGWVSAVSGLPHTAQSRAVGNGVVPRQTAPALTILDETLGGGGPRWRP